MATCDVCILSPLIEIVLIGEIHLVISGLGDIGRAVTDILDDPSHHTAKDGEVTGHITRIPHESNAVA
jgi:hypothetical protein